MAAIAAERARVIAVPPADTRTEEYRRRREYSKFDQEIADKLIAAGLIASVDELEAWRERQRQGSGKSISEQLAEVQQSDRIH